MKNGKLFGKLNVIDLLVILVIVAAVALVGFSLASSSGEEKEGSVTVAELTEANIRFTVRCKELPQLLVDNVIADLEKGSYTVSGEQVSPRRIFNSGEILDGQIVEWWTEPGEEEGTVNFYAVVEACATTPNGVYALQYQEIRLGKSYTLKTLGIELNGETIAVEKLS